MKLYGYWRSSATYRVRIAMNLKGLAYEYRPVNRLKNEQTAPDYLAVSPQGLVPTFFAADGAATTCSLSWPSRNRAVAA
ncbi:MAG: glutathione S-transferase N-terminal domain-containing protein, partial [Parvularculaceae bacterium]|nr:glutathione S-transferase N-terminal domain-containing protein [Parvularculaceae bacterium]